MSKETVKYQKLSQALAKKVRAKLGMTDEFYQLLTVFNARIRFLEEALDDHECCSCKL